MRTKASLLRAVVMAFGLGLLATGGLFAQTQTASDVRDFEVLAVDGNRVIFRDQKGTHDLTVPDDFRFKVDGRQMSAKELKPGMKGQATVTTTTTTTIAPVTVTEVREATVVSTTSHSVTVRGAEGVRRFSQSELDKRGIQMIKDGRVVGISKLEPGDVVTATFISNEPPTVVTETEVDMKLAQAKVAPAPDKSPSAAPVAAAPASAAPVSEASAPAAPEAPATSTPPQQSASWLLWVAILGALAALVAYVVRRKKG